MSPHLVIGREDARRGCSAAIVPARHRLW
jgi:hypothetical protein